MQSTRPDSAAQLPHGATLLPEGDASTPRHHGMLSGHEGPTPSEENLVPTNAARADDADRLNAPFPADDPEEVDSPSSAGPLAAPHDAQPVALRVAHPDEAAANEGESATPRDHLTAKYVAARGFLWGEWLGATLCLLSFTQLYFAVAVRVGSGAWAVGLGLFLLAVGAFVFLRSRTYYLRLGVSYRPRSHNFAAVVAGAGAIFWLLFAFLMALTYFGYPILKE